MLVWWGQEYVHEDLAVMKKELDQWREECAKRNDVSVDWEYIT